MSGSLPQSMLPNNLAQIAPRDPGLTLRQYFAVVAYHALLTRDPGSAIDHVAVDAVQAADFLIAALAKQEGVAASVSPPTATIEALPDSIFAKAVRNQKGGGK